MNKYFSIILLITLVACGTNESNQNIDNKMMGYGNGSGGDYELLDKMSLGELTDNEIEGILFMREEEKLAQDVYLTLYDEYEQKIFKNIARSEGKHTEAVLRLINRYELDDPVTSNEIGVFQNQDLQNLYDNLLIKGKISLDDALLVGAEIEEIDILDLQKYMDEVDENDDIIFVYDNLLRGSRNHLRAFTRNLKIQNIDYVPLHLTQDEFNEIINSDHETGKGRKNGKGGKKGGRNGSNRHGQRGSN